MPWIKFASRNSDVQKTIQFARGTAQPFSDFFGTEHIHLQRYIFDGRTTAIYFDRADYEAFCRSFQKLLVDLKFLQAFSERALERCRQTLQRAERISKRMEEDPLLLFQTFVDVWNDFYPIGWSPFYFTPLDRLVKEGLETLGLEGVDALVSMIAQPERETPMMRAEVDQLRCAELLRESPLQAEVFAEYMAAEYGWMSVYNFLDEPFRADTYLARARELLASENVKERMQFIKIMQEKRAKEYTALMHDIQQEPLRSQIALLHDLGFIRDAREECRDKLTMLERPLYERIAVRAGLALREVTALHDDEIVDLLNGVGTTNALKVKITARLERFAIDVQGTTIRLIDDTKEQDDVVCEVRSLEAMREVRGTIACSARRIQGVVRIVLNARECQKVQEGDILVTTMTKPDFLPAMKRASAFITDEGGLTCHAAIIAREMNKPCIIGTKVATTTLRDGDLVDVDTQDGVVRLLPRET